MLSSEVRLVEFRALNITCVLVSLACPIMMSSDVFIHAKRSEKSLLAVPANEAWEAVTCLESTI